MYHDQWEDFYYNYRVTGCSWKIRALNQSSTGYEAYIAVAPLTNSVIAGNLEEYRQYKFCQTRLLSKSQDRSSLIKGYMNIKKFVGNNWEQKDYGGAFGSNPDLQVYLHVVADDAFQGANSVTVLYEVILTYYVQL